MPRQKIKKSERDRVSGQVDIAVENFVAVAVEQMQFHRKFYDIVIKILKG